VSQQATDVTIGELARVISKLDAQMQSVGAQVAQVASDVRVVRTQLDAHVERQTDRTAARDRQVREVRDEHAKDVAELRAEHVKDVGDIADVLKKLRADQDETSKWRWTVVGKWSGAVAAMTLAGGGGTFAAMKILGA
jgi:hypothetical protein